MNELTVQLRVNSVRSRGKPGGAIFSGSTDSGENYVAVCDYRLIPDSSLVDKGQVWIISGALRSSRTTGKNGYILQESQIDANSAELHRPAGRNIISWIANSSDCLGIGQVKAQKLWDRYGQDLIEHINQYEIGGIAEVVGEESAILLCNAFAKFNVAKTLLWLDQIGMPRNIGVRIVSYYKDEAQPKIEANPYILLSFEANWKRVDDLARSRFGITLDDPRRLVSSIEQALYDAAKQGHTCLPERALMVRLANLLKAPALLASAMKVARIYDDQPPRFQLINGLYQLTGMHLIESYVARRLHQMVLGEDEIGQVGLFSQIDSTPAPLEKIIATHELANGITLSEEQKTAVLTSANHHLSLILGGAGTGKTTVLKALYNALKEIQPGVAIYQLALAGRAAQRMAEATGLEAFTIASFLNKIDPGWIEIGSVIVVDEMSMVDVLLMYRLLRHIPNGVKLILVGDPSQLPPIGPGLVLHALAGNATIPQTELKVVKRQSAASGIPHVAAAIRAHEAPPWTKYQGKPSTGVSFIRCATDQIEATVHATYEDLGGTATDFSVQILSITNAGFGGVKNLNIALHDQYQSEAEYVYCLDPQFGSIVATTLDRIPLRVGDLVIYTENNYQLGLRNGSLGRIIQALPALSHDDPCCLCEFEGIEFLLNSSEMQAIIHAYGITVHKSQGSQFRRIIVPIRKSRLLDQTLVYTAVTRGVDQVVLVGDEEACINAIKAPASAANRHITLPSLLANTSTQINRNRGVVCRS